MAWLHVVGRTAQLAAAALLAALMCGCASEDAGGSLATVHQAALDGVSDDALLLPNAAASVKFAVIGDSGRGTRPQREVADRMARYHQQFAFPFTIMLGDNLYEGVATPEDYRLKFEQPYEALLRKGVEFYAVLGNHDDPRQIHYDRFHMKSHRYYSFAPPGNLLARIATTVEFFALDSTSIDRSQLQWLDERLAASTATWKICFLHHPLYTSGRYRRSSLVQRATLEPLFVAHDVDAVFSGHEHIYQRSTLQRGVQYFVSGGAGSLREGDGVPASYIARTYSGDYHFMLVEIDGDQLHFQAISRSGRTIDAGTLSRSRTLPGSRVRARDTVGRR